MHSVNNQQMEQFMPLEMVKNNFKAQISKLQIINKDDNVAIYKAITSFGHMTLIVQSFFSSHQHPIEKYHNNLIIRNKLILNQSIITPLIYEQEIISMRQDYIICMTLCEPIALCSRQDIVSQRAESLFENLVKCAYSISRSQLSYELECYGLKIFIKSTQNSNYYLDFTKISLFGYSQQQVLHVFMSSLCEILQQCREKTMQEILFICQYPFVFNLQKIQACRSWFQIAMLFNLVLQDKVNVITESRTKIMPISKLSGTIKIEYEGVIYQDYNFRDGFRIDGIKEVTFEDLKLRFFEQKMIYYMTKEKYMCVRKQPIEKQEQWILNKIQYEDLIYVRPEVSKVEFINFLIAYIKYIDPILHELNFYADQNILQLVFTNKVNIIRKVAVKFHHKYVVKDEQLSMIIQKSRIKDASIFLENMNFGDSFLIFLANCDKMIKVKALDISYCSKITESGMNILLSSPFCANIAVLKICSLPLPDFEILKTKIRLKQLYVNDCSTFQDDQQVNFGQLKIQRLEAIGLKLNFKFSDTLRYLYINQDVTIDHLKFLKHLPLIELKLKLVENKKIITSFLSTFNNFYSKDHPLKAFCQGSCRKTLKTFDISSSTVRLKDIKPILSIETLQTLICDSIDKERFGDFILPHHIISLSLKGSKVTAQIFQEMTQKINFFIKLNLIGTDITELTLEQSIKNKKFINFLQISEQQMSLKFFCKKICVQGISVHLQKLIRDDNEYILNQFLLQQVNTCKQINLVCQQKYQGKLVAKINRFLSLYQERLRKIASQVTLNINSIPIYKLLHWKGRENNNQYYVVVDKKYNHYSKINFCTLLAQQYRLSIIQQYINIDLFNVTLHKMLYIYPNNLISISIRSNRLLSKQVVKLIHKYAASHLLSFDFRNCLFSYAEVQQDLYQFPYLQCVNEGQYQIVIAEQDECEEQLQKILKFYMKLNQQKMKLRLKAYSISEVQLYFSIMYEIIHHHANSLVMLEIYFENIHVDQQSQIFWKRVFLLEKLEHFNLHYKNDFDVHQDEYMIIAVQFEKLSNFNLFCLEIDTSISILIPQSIASPHIRKLALNYSQMDINENVVSKMLRSVPSLNHLTIQMQSCSVSSVTKISDSLQKMVNLVHLTLDFENCPLKENSIFQLIESLHKNTLLERVQININNISIAINQLVKACQNLIHRIKFCHITIIALQVKKVTLSRDESQLLRDGIQVILA